jgi:3-methyladenine DNA glycosylase AlkD
MARYGIKTDSAFGVRIPVIRKIARETGKSHELAGKLWAAGIHEARILAAMVDEPGKVTKAQADRWAGEFNSWDLCDQACNNLLDKTPFAREKAFQWSGDKREFVKRAGFVLMATLSVHDKKAPDADFEVFFPVIIAQSGDARNYVKKAVNWALRQIGKRNPALRKKAALCAKELLKTGTPSAKWIATDALREFALVEEKAKKTNK